MIKKLIFSLLCSGLVITTTAIWAGGETGYVSLRGVINNIKGNFCDKKVAGQDPDDAVIYKAACKIRLYNNFFKLCSYPTNANSSDCRAFGIDSDFSGTDDGMGSHNSYGGSQFGSTSTHAQDSLQRQEYLPPPPITSRYVAPTSSSTKKNNKLGTWF